MGLSSRVSMWPVCKFWPVAKDWEVLEVVSKRAEGMGSGGSAHLLQPAARIKKMGRG